jgi:hypothetical protein
MGEILLGVCGHLGNGKAFDLSDGWFGHGTRHADVAARPQRLRLLCCDRRMMLAGQSVPWLTEPNELAVILAAL